MHQCAVMVRSVRLTVSPPPNSALFLHNNQLTELPSDVFNGLNSLRSAHIFILVKSK